MTPGIEKAGKIQLHFIVEGNDEIPEIQLPQFQENALESFEEAGKYKGLHPNPGHFGF